jgi:SAM-dependent methyltransferase
MNDIYYPGCTLSESDWEAMWSPYDEGTYQVVLSQIHSQDLVLDIGAGDLRLTCRIAAIAQKVYAIEKQKELVNRARAALAKNLQKNLIIIQADARSLPFPTEVTTAVLLMRHCRHFALYVAKLKANGCQRLITNARWRFEPEVIDLQAERIPFSELSLGWYACICGSTGFKPGPIELLTSETEATIFEVKNCPACPNSDGPYLNL